MRELLLEAAEWCRSGAAFALATVVERSWSAPRGPGTAMAVGSAGAVLGSLSGGCVESAVYELAGQVLADGQPRLVEYADGGPLGVGLPCGGHLTVHVSRVDPLCWPELPGVVDALAAGTPLVIATRLDRDARLVRTADGPLAGQGGPGPLPDLGDAELTRAVLADAAVALATATTGLNWYPPGNGSSGVPMFVQAFPAPARLVVIGSTDYAAALAQLGAMLGYRVSVCDARGVFTTRARFPDVDDLVVAWPPRYLSELALTAQDVVCVVAHDPRFEAEVLRIALNSAAGYVGAMGSRNAHADRVERLLAAGLDARALARLRSPVGLDLGAENPAGTAVSIFAEIIAERTGASGRPLRTTHGPIHVRDHR